MEAKNTVEESVNVAEEEVNEDGSPKTLGVVVIDDVKSLDIGPGQGRRK